MTTARTFKLLEDIYFNVGNKNINTFDSKSGAPERLTWSQKQKREISGNLMKVKQIYVIR